MIEYETREREYCQAMDSLRFSQEDKDRMLENLRVAERPARRRRRFRPAAVVALALVLALGLTIGAGAAGLLGPVSEVFAPLFGGKESQAEVIERLGRPIVGASDTQAGVTVSADAVLADGRNGVLLFTVRREDGQPLVPEDAENFGYLVFGYSGGSTDEDHPLLFANRESRFVDYAPGESGARYLLFFSIDPERGAPQTIHWEFSDLEYWDQNGAFMARVGALERGAGWRLEFPLPVLEDSCRALEGAGESFSRNGVDFVLREITVSPLAVNVTYEVTSESLDPEALKAGDLSIDGSRFVEGMTLALRRKDGTEMDLSTWISEFGQEMSGGSFTVDENRYVGHYGGALPEIVPLEDMDCVIFNGIEYPVNP